MVGFDPNKLEEALKSLSLKSQNGDLDAANEIRQLVEAAGVDLIGLSSYVPDYLLLVVTLLNDGVIEKAKNELSWLARHTISQEKLEKLTQVFIEEEGKFIYATIVHRCPGINLTRMYAAAFDIIKVAADLHR